MEDKTNNDKKTLITFRLWLEDRRKIEQKSKDQSKTISDYIRNLIKKDIC